MLCQVKLFFVAQKIAEYWQFHMVKNKNKNNFNNWVLQEP
jgi:hypothetical protein